MLSNCILVWSEGFIVWLWAISSWAKALQPLKLLSRYENIELSFTLMKHIVHRSKERRFHPRELTFKIIATLLLKISAVRFFNPSVNQPSDVDRFIYTYESTHPKQPRAV